MKKVNWFQKFLCNVASSIIHKYDIHKLNVNSRIIMNGKLYIITSYQQRSTIDEASSITFDGISPLLSIEYDNKYKKEELSEEVFRKMLLSKWTKYNTKN